VSSGSTGPAWPPHAIDGTMPRVKILPALPRPLAGVMLAGVAAAALLTSACSTSVPGEATAQSESERSDLPSAQAAPPTSRSSGTSGRSCQVTVSSTGSISSSGAGGRTVTVNGRTSFSCGRGPLIAIEEIDDSGVTFSADGAVVAVAPGSTGTVGAYRISVTGVEAGSAEFQVEPTG
jgi:hypothetical protein